MTTAAAPVPDTAAPRPLTPAGAVVMLVAALAVAGLLAVSVSHIFPPKREGVAASESGPVPAAVAPAPQLAGVAPTITFDGATGLTAGALGEWTTAAGAWSVVDGVVRPTDVGEDGALAVVTAPAATIVAQVTLVDPRPGAGLVVSYRGPDSYVALQVDRSGRSVQVAVVDGSRTRPELLVEAPLSAPDQPVVLALVREASGVEAVANGTTIGHPILEDPVTGPWSVGLVTGSGPTAAAARFDDLVVR